MIIQMRDEEGKNWGEINESWMKMTGIKVGTSTLRMRYTTMKANFVEFTGEDVCASSLFVAFLALIMVYADGSCVGSKTSSFEEGD